VVPGRHELEERLSRLDDAFPGSAGIARPDRWCGYRVVPSSVEFWQESGDGIHDRWRCRSTGGSWIVERLAP
jgi:pyridoxamine 5'-phosphate oxidase